MKKQPFEMLQGTLSVGRCVRIKVGKRAGHLATVIACLTPSTDPTFITGAARYALSVDGGQTADYCRHEVAKASREQISLFRVAAR